MAAADRSDGFSVASGQGARGEGDADGPPDAVDGVEHGARGSKFIARVKSCKCCGNRSFAQCLRKRRSYVLPHPPSPHLFPRTGATISAFAITSASKLHYIRYHARRSGVAAHHTPLPILKKVMSGFTLTSIPMGSELYRMSKV